ncbi:FAD-binding protein [Patescibacteria group bacterium]|nr:FAD-binding protein [Patescibacteria group bacterium]
MESKFKLLIDSFGKERFKFNEPLKQYFATEVGGPAKLFFIVFVTQELIKIINLARDLNLPFLLFGTGSKIMISDQGFDGLVIKNRTKNIQTVSVKGKVTKYGIGVDEALVEVDSGVSIKRFMEYLDTQGLESIDFAGVPGSIGGALFVSRFLQNRTKSIKILDLKSEIAEISPGILSPKKHIIISALFRIRALKR